MFKYIPCACLYSRCDETAKGKNFTETTKYWTKMIAALFIGLLLIGGVLGLLAIGYRSATQKESNIEQVPILGWFAAWTQTMLGQKPPSATVLTPGGQTVIITGQPGTTPTGATGEKSGSYKIQYTITDGYGATPTTGNEYVTFMLNGNYKVAYTSVADPAAAATTDKTFLGGPNGDRVDIVVASDTDETAATDYFMHWFTIERLADRAAIVNKVTGGVVGYVVFYQDGTNTYWQINDLPLIPQASAANIDIYLRLRGTTLVQMTDGSSYEDTQAEQNADGSMSENTDNMSLDIQLGAKRISAFNSYLVIDGQGNPQLRESFVVVAFNNTNMKIRTGEQGQSGSPHVWKQVSIPSTSWVAYALKLVPISGTSLTQGAGSITIPLLATDVATRGETVGVYVYLTTGQTESAIMAFSGTSAKADAYGAFGTSGNQMSPDLPIFARPPSLSSGTPQNPVLSADFTVPTS